MSSPIRSYLFVPGNRPERFDKAVASEADAVILDLEDAVPPDQKSVAREAVEGWLSDARHRAFVRVNAAATPWFGDDLRLARLPGVAGIVLPKAERVNEIAAAAGDDAATPVLPLIETALGLSQAAAIARAAGVQCLVFGSVDFQLDLGLASEEAELLPYRAQLVLASRLAGIDAPVDGVSTALDDPDRLREDALRSRRLGFGGKLCIHPRQAGIVNECFTPTEAQVAWARRVLEAAEKSGGAAVAVDGKMVDRPVVLEAQRMVREAGDRARRRAERAAARPPA